MGGGGGRRADRAGYGLLGGGGGIGGTFSCVYRSELSLDLNLKQSSDSAVTTSWGRLFQSGMVLRKSDICLYCVLQDGIVILFILDCCHCCQLFLFILDCCHCCQLILFILDC